MKKNFDVCVFVININLMSILCNCRSANSFPVQFQLENIFRNELKRFRILDSLFLLQYVNSYYHILSVRDVMYFLH